MSNEISLAEFLTETWLPACEATVRPTTFVSYAGHVRLHIIPHLGDIPLGELTPQHLNRLYAELRARGRLNREKGLSPATVRLVHTTLRRALKDAVRWGYRADSPADGADAPRMRAGDWIEMKTWTADQLRTFLSFVKDDPLYPLWHMYAMTGMRRGELLGLRWSDVDLPAARLAVRQTVVVLKGKFISSQPKTARGRRVIALDPGTVEVLRALQARSKHWQALIPSELVFPGPDGDFLSPAMVTMRFAKLVRDARLPRIRLHDLRHTHATLALQAGIHPKIVSERLGHSTVAFTLDIYSHALGHLQTEAAEQIAALVFP